MRPGQINGMRRLSQAFNDYERLREFKLAGLAVDGLPNQRQIGKAHDDIASERRIGWICPDDITIRPDRPQWTQALGSL